MSKKMIGDSPVEYFFKNKDPAKTHAPPSSANSVCAEFRRCQRSWSRGDHGRRRDLQGKSKPELGVLRQDPPTLKWEGLEYFTTSGRYALYCDNNEGTKAYIESYQNLRFYWILGAGHFVPLDQPCMALKMLGDVTQSPVASSSYMKT